MNTILVCDDEADIVSALKIYLTAEGYRVLTAGNGRQALEILDRERVDLVLMDIMMPEMDGLEATRRIRRMDRKDAETVPIFAMSANAFDDDVARSRAAGMNEHLSKPLSFEKAAAVIAQYVRKNEE